MISFITGNILNANQRFICQQVNCQNVMGAGLADSIAKKWNTVKIQYNNFCIFHYKRNIELLGKFQIVPIGHDQYIINIFAQRDYGRNKNIVYTDYEAFEKAINKLFSLYPGDTYAFPYKIGCGLANGDWDTIYRIIKEASDRYNTKVTFYTLSTDMMELINNG